MYVFPTMVERNVVLNFYFGCSPKFSFLSDFLCLVCWLELSLVTRAVHNDRRPDLHRERFWQSPWNYYPTLHNAALALCFFNAFNHYWLGKPLAVFQHHFFCTFVFMWNLVSALCSPGVTAESKRKRVFVSYAKEKSKDPQTIRKRSIIFEESRS